MTWVEGDLDQKWSVHRTDILNDEGIYQADEHRKGRAVRPRHVISLLGVSERELLNLIASGVLPRPGKWGGNRVAWRADEVAAAREWIDSQK